MSPTGRLFASTIFTFEHVGAAAAHCKNTLPDQHRHRAANLFQTWQSRITCTYISYLGSKFDTKFIADQAFAPNPHVQAASAEGSKVLEAKRGGDGVFPLDAPSEGFLGRRGGRSAVLEWRVGRDRC